MRLWLYHHLPAGLLWHPAEWFVAFMCAVSGTITLTTGVRSGALEQLLPEIPYRVWGGFLVVGALALASGLSSIRAVDADRYVITRVAAYRLGLRLLALVVGLYIAAAFLYAGWDGIPAAILPTAFVGMAVVRLIRLGGPEDRRNR
jgi:hypothetical protein